MSLETWTMSVEATEIAQEIQSSYTGQTRQQEYYNEHVRSAADWAGKLAFWDITEPHIVRATE